jgi:hypothetical protein
MKKKLLMPFLFMAMASYAQINTHWATNFGSPNNEAGHVICADNNGNSYMAGVYWNSLQICNAALPAVVQPSSGITINYMISRLDSNGNCLWTKIGKSINSPAGSVVGYWSDIKYYNGFIYAVGNFSGKMIFGNDTLKNTGCNFGCYTLFAIKMDTSGNFIWAKAFNGNTGYNQFGAVIPVPGGVYIGATYTGSLGVGTFTLNSVTNFASVGFIAKLNHQGNALWAVNTVTGTQSASLYDMCYDGTNGLYTTGNFSGASLVFPNTTLTGTNSNQFYGTYIARYDTLGNYVWAIGGKAIFGGNFSSTSIGCNSSGIFFSGLFTDSARCNPSTYTTAPQRWKDILIKTTPSGQVLWSKVFGNQSGWGAFDSHSAVTPQGILLASLVTESVVIGTYTVNSAGTQDNLITYFDNNSNLITLKRFGGSAAENPKDICFRNDRIYITGYSESSYQFDNSTIVNQGNMDVQVARFRMPSPLGPGTGLSELKAAELVLSYPNPSSGLVFVRSSNHMPLNNVSVFNLQGQLVQCINTSESSVTISGLASGTYLLHILLPTQKVTKRIVVIN